MVNGYLAKIPQALPTFEKKKIGHSAVVSRKSEFEC